MQNEQLEPTICPHCKKNIIIQSQVWTSLIKGEQVKSVETKMNEALDVIRDLCRKITMEELEKELIKKKISKEEIPKIIRLLERKGTIYQRKKGKEIEIEYSTIC